jgi:uncharacterized protein (TIGR02996 family)
MTERDALLRAVCENPDDDTPRLVFADWLQENGEEPRAEFIRVQIELARGANDPRLKQREQELLAAWRDVWAGPFRQFEVADSSRRFVFGVHFRRGFPWAISINDEDQRFVDNAAALFRLGPIERVNLFHKSQHGDLSRCAELLRVKELLIDRAGFETEEIAALLRSKYLTSITRLDLIADDDNGHLDCEGLEQLGQATTLPALRHLDLSYNFCGWMFSEDRDWVKSLTKENLIGQLETLRLRSTDVNDESAQVLARCTRARSLRHLDLSGNSIGEDGLRALATSRALSALTTLDHRGNLYDTEDGVAVRGGCTPEIRQLLEARFGSGVLLDGQAEPHPLDELFKQFA